MRPKRDITPRERLYERGLQNPPKKWGRENSPKYFSFFLRDTILSNPLKAPELKERREEKVAAKKVEIALAHRYWSPTELEIEIQYQVTSE